MILRVVKMTFRPEELEPFLNFFQTVRSQIEAMPGLLNLKLYQDEHNECVVFTLSSWLNQGHLNNYRNSEVFGQVWPKTKTLFADKPQAWSLKLK